MKFHIAKQCHSAGGDYLQGEGKPEGYSSRELAESAAKLLTKNSSATFVILQELARIRMMPMVISEETA